MAAESFRCGECGREFHSQKSGVLKMLAENRRACTYCRGELVFSDAILAEHQRRTSVPQDARPMNVPCPACGRDKKVEPVDRGQAVQCTWCGARYLAPATPGAPVKLGPMQEGPLADEALAAQTTQRWRERPIFGAVTQALQARARSGELLRDELVAGVETLSALDAWTPRLDQRFLPLSHKEAVEVVPRLVFGAAKAFLDGDPRHPEVVMIMESRSRGDGGAKLAGAMVMTLVMGAARSMAVDEEHQTDRQVRVRLALMPVEGGVVLQPAHQVDDQRPTAFSPAELHELGIRIGACRLRLISYFSMLAIFGSGLRGNAAMVVTPQALRIRLSGLGLAPQVDGLLAALRLEPAARALGRDR